MKKSQLLEEYDLRARTLPWTIYPLTCVPKILPWHESKADVRVLAGPNRGGKTTAGAFEILCYATGYNPIRDEHYRTPNICWAVCIDYQGTSGKVMLRKLREMMPRHSNGEPNYVYNKQEHIFRLGKPWGSEIHVKTQQEGREHFYGEGCQAIWFDEGKEGESGEENWNECYIRRIPGIPLKIFLTLTPLNGYDWLWNKVWNENSKSYLPGVFKHRFEIEDCFVEKGGFWTKAEVEEFAKNYPDYEKAARLKGDWSPFGHMGFFSTAQLVRAMDRAPTGIPIRFRPGIAGVRTEETQDGPGRIFRPRESGHQYIIAWDPSSGVGGDPSALVVLDRRDLAEVYHCNRNDIPPKDFADQIVVPAQAYFNDALVAIEVNGEGGGAAIEAVRDTCANLYTMQEWDKAKATLSNKLGWRTLGGMEGTRGRMLDSVARALREGATFSQETLSEMSNVVVKKTEAGKKRVEHRDGFHDDLVMAWGMAAAIHYEDPVVDYPAWGKLKVRYQTPEILSAEYS